MPKLVSRCYVSSNLSLVSWDKTRISLLRPKNFEAGLIVVGLIAVGSNVDGLIAAGLFADLIAAPRSAALKTAAEPQTL